MGLHRQGASRGATVSFLIATPENGADSIALSYALLGPFMTVARPITAAVSAIVTGVLARSIIAAQASAGHELIPVWLSVTSVAVLAFFAIRPLRRLVLGL